MKRGDLVLTSDNYLGIIIKEVTIYTPSQWKVFCGNGLVNLYLKSSLQSIHFKSTRYLLVNSSKHPVANFSELLKED